MWGRVLSQDEVNLNMWRERPESEEGLSALYIFGADGIKGADAAGGTAAVALDRSRERRGAGGIRLFPGQRSACR